MNRVDHGTTNVHPATPVADEVGTTEARQPTRVGDAMPGNGVGEGDGAGFGFCLGVG